MHQPEDLSDDGCVVRILLEPDQFTVDHIDVLGGLDNKITQHVVHRLLP